MGGPRFPRLIVFFLQLVFFQVSSQIRKTSSAQSPRSVQPPGNSQTVKEEQRDTPGSPDGGDLSSETLNIFVVGSIGLGGSCSAPESSASLDLCTESPEVTEPRKCPEEARGPEGSPLPGPHPPWEQECPSASMPFAKCSPEGCLASPAEAPEDGPFTQRPGREPSPNAPGDAVAACAPKGGSSTQHSVVAVNPSARREKELKEEEQKSSSSSSCIDQVPGISPVPTRELVKGQLHAEHDQPGGLGSQGKEAAGSFSPPESRQEVASVQVSPKAPAEAQLGKESSAGLEESSPLKPKTLILQDPAPRTSEREKCPVEVLPQDLTGDLKFFKACRPTGSNSGAAQEAEVNAASQESCEQQTGAHQLHADLLQDALDPALAAGARSSWKETLDASDAQGHLQTGIQGTEPREAVCVAAGGQLEENLLVSTESSPLTPTEEMCPASNLTSHLAAPILVATEGPSWLARETVSGAEVPVPADPAQELVDARMAGLEKHVSDLRSEREHPEGSLGEVPAPSPQDRGEHLSREQSPAVQQGLLPPPAPSASSDSARRSLEPEDEVSEDTESLALAKEESRSPGDNLRGQEEAPEPSDSADLGNVGADESQALSCKPDPEVEKDAVSKLSSDAETRVLPSSDSAQPPRKEGAGHTDGPDCQSAEADACASLHELHEEDLVLPPAPDGTGEHAVPEGAIGEGLGLQTKCPAILQGKGGLGRMESLPALESEKSDFLSSLAAEVLPKAQEVDSTLEIKTTGPLSSPQSPCSCDGDGLLTLPGQPHEPGHDTSGQEVRADVPCTPVGEILAVDSGLTTLSLEKDRQGNLSCPGDSQITEAASERPPLSSEPCLQPSQLDPEASVFDVLREKVQPPEKGKETYPRDLGFKNKGTDSSQIHMPLKPWEDVKLPTHGGQECASGTELQSELPKGCLSEAPSSSPRELALVSSLTEESEVSAPARQKLPAPAENGQEGAGRGGQPSRVSPPAADSLKDSSLAGDLSRKESCCAGQGPNKSQQELAGALEAGSLHEEARRREAGVSDAADTWPPLQGLGKTETASRNTAGTPPCPPDSPALLHAARCLPAPEPASSRVTPTQDAPERQACDETQAGRLQPALAPQQEMECPATSDAEAPKFLGSLPSAGEQGSEGGTAETGGNADEGVPGMQQGPEEPEEAAQNGGFFQPEPCLMPGEDASTSALGEPCQAEQPAPSCQEALLPAGELGGIPRSTVDISAHQAVPDPNRLQPSGPPEEAAPHTLYLHIDGAARKGAEDSGVKPVSSESPRAPSESPCPIEEPLLALENAGPVKLSAGSLTSLLQPGAAGGEISAVQASSGRPKAGTVERPVDSVPYLDRMPLLAKGKEMTGEEKTAMALGTGAKPSEIPASRATEEGVAGGTATETEGSGERTVEPSQDPRRGAAGGVDTSSKQIGGIAGLPDFRQHLTKIFEKPVIGALTTNQPQSTPGEKAGAGRSVASKELPMLLSPEKLLDGTQGVAVIPLPAPPAGLWVEKKQGLAVEAVSQLDSQNPAPDKLPALAGLALEKSLPGASVGSEMTGVPPIVRSNKRPDSTGEGWLCLEGQAHSQQRRDGQESASGLSSKAATQGIPVEKASDFQVAPQSPRVGACAQVDGIPSGKQHQEASACNSQNREDSTWDVAHTGEPGDVPGSACALEASSPHENVLIMPEANNEPWTPDSLEDDRRPGGATSILEMHNALHNQSTLEPSTGEVLDTPLEPGKVAGAAGGAKGDVMLSTAETQARASGDLPEVGTTRVFSSKAQDLVLPGSCQDPGCSDRTWVMEDAATVHGDSPTVHQQAEEHPGPEYPTPAGDGKVGVSSPPEPDETRDLKLQRLAPEEIQADRESPGLGPSNLPSVPEDATRVTGEVTSDEARVAGATESSPAAADVIQPAAPTDQENPPLAASSHHGDVIGQVSTDLTAQSASPAAARADPAPPASEHAALPSVPAGDGVEASTPSCQDLAKDLSRSSDSEEAFETPESTTPVKAPPAPPPPPPEVIPEPEVSTPPPPEEPGCGSETVPIPDGPRSDSVEGSPFRPPSHSFSAVFDEDKPIASSGTYNLDFDSIELVDSLQALEPRAADSKTQECKASSRRKSTDSLPISRSALSRSLSLQAGDFDGASCSGSPEAVSLAPDTCSTGSSSASSTLKRTKKPRPPSLKKKQTTKKPTEAPPVKETEQEPAEESPVLSEENPAKTELAKTQDSGPASLEETPVETACLPDPESAEGANPPASGGGRVQNSPPVGRKTQLLTTALEAVEVTPSDSGGQEDSPAKGLSVRLEFDYSEDKGSWDNQQENPPPTKKTGKKQAAKMPLRRPKMKKTPEKLDHTPASPTRSPAEPNDIPIAKGTYTFDIDKWDDPNFNPFSSTSKMQESPKLPQQSYSFDPDACDESIDPFKTSSKTPSSPSKSPASFEIPASTTEANGVDGDGLNKPAKKKKTPLKTDTFRVKKSPKRSPLSDPPSQDPTPAGTPETPPVISAVVHATDEEKLAVTNQKWTCMTVDLEADKQDYPQPSDLSTFVNETKFNSPTEELDYRNSYEIEYMEKIGSSLPQDDDAPKKQALYLMFDTSQESPIKSPPVRMSDSPTPCSGSSFEETEALVNATAKIQHPVVRGLASNQEPHLQVPEKSSQKELEAMALGSPSEAIEITAPEGSLASADALLSRLAHPASLCGALDYLEPDLAEKNPPVFAQKLQREAAHPTDVSISKTALYSRIGTSEVEKSAGLLFQQPDLDSALQIARAEIITKEREVSEWKDKYEESRREVMEMRKIVAEYEKTIAQMIEDEQREKSVSHQTVQQLVLEKEQALADLNSVEKSLADLFRRYEKMKEVLEGFRKNEEVLKKCAQEYLSRVKKEEQRYQALKVHAEEKLDRANAEIAQVRGKAQQEQAAYQASLRKEQLRVDALERTLEQK
ncbi:PREDICTED: transforming acidic coiled-coil-containing protein 2, partial [Galeopterus variegatus]|uniref:Transforming acidic coiled-coil-containing protein 2 n=1 Tax=Galeopterus variegatus TaxID=482537 RepID=A0ABM0RW77_GALVR